MEPLTIGIIVVLLILAYFLYTYYKKSQELTALLGEKTKSLEQKIKEYQELRDKYNVTVDELEQA
jgi:cell division protein FtsL